MASYGLYTHVPITYHLYKPYPVSYGPYVGRNGQQVGWNQSKIAQNKPFLPQYRPYMVMIWPHMASTPMSLSYTTFTSHIQCHMGSGSPSIASNGGFLGDISPPRSLKMTIAKPIFDLEPCTIHQSDPKNHPNHLHDSELSKSKIISLKITKEWRNQLQNPWKSVIFACRTVPIEPVGCEIKNFIKSKIVPLYLLYLIYAKKKFFGSPLTH